MRFKKLIIKENMRVGGVYTYMVCVWPCVCVCVYIDIKVYIYFFLKV